MFKRVHKYYNLSEITKLYKEGILTISDIKTTCNKGQRALCHIDPIPWLECVWEKSVCQHPNSSKCGSPQPQ